MRRNVLFRRLSLALCVVALCFRFERCPLSAQDLDVEPRSRLFEQLLAVEMNALELTYALRFANAMQLGCPKRRSLIAGQV